MTRQKTLLAPKVVLLTVMLCLPFTSFAGVIVSFEAETNVFGSLSSPLPASQVFSGSFTIDDTVTPIGNSSTSNFNGAFDNVSFTLGGQTFGGTDGRYRQFTNINGTSGFIGATLNSSIGTTFGSYNDGTDVWDFTGLSIDWRGLAAELFPSGDHSLIGTDFGRSDDGDNSNDEISYALMNLNFENQNSLADTSLRVSFNSITYESTSVPEPTSIILLGFGLMGMGYSRRKKSA